MIHDDSVPNQSADSDANTIMEETNKFRIGDVFYIESVRGKHFTVITVEGADVRVVDTKRRKYNIEADRESLYIWRVDGGIGKEIDMEEVHIIT